MSVSGIISWYFIKYSIFKSLTSLIYYASKLPAPDCGFSHNWRLTIFLHTVPNGPQYCAEGPSNQTSRNSKTLWLWIWLFFVLFLIFLGKWGKRNQFKYCQMIIAKNKGEGWNELECDVDSHRKGLGKIYYWSWIVSKRVVGGRVNSIQNFWVNFFRTWNRRVRNIYHWWLKN